MYDIRHQLVLNVECVIYVYELNDLQSPSIHGSFYLIKNLIDQ